MGLQRRLPGERVVSREQRRLREANRFHGVASRCHAAKEFHGATGPMIWKTAKAECVACNIGVECVEVLQCAYSSDFRNIYSVLPMRDPCPHLFCDWLRDATLLKNEARLLTKMPNSAT